MKFVEARVKLDATPLPVGVRRPWGVRVPFLRSLARLFTASSQPIYLLDDQRRVVYCNEACENWLAMMAEELIGQQCSYHSGDPAQLATERAAALCPPPAVFLGERRQAVIVSAGRRESYRNAARSLNPWWGKTRR